jgi:hypothetical protein
VVYPERGLGIAYPLLADHSPRLAEGEGGLWSTRSGDWVSRIRSARTTVRDWRRGRVDCGLPGAGLGSASPLLADHSPRLNELKGENIDHTLAT